MKNLFVFSIVFSILTAGFAQAQTPAQKTAREVELERMLAVSLQRNSVAETGRTTSIEGEVLGTFKLQKKNALVFGRESEGPLEVWIDGSDVSAYADDEADFAKLVAAGGIQRFGDAQKTGVGDFVLTHLKSKSGGFIPGWLVPAGTAPAPAPATEPSSAPPAPAAGS